MILQEVKYEIVKDIHKLADELFKELTKDENYRIQNFLIYKWAVYNNYEDKLPNRFDHYTSYQPADCLKCFPRTVFLRFPLSKFRTPEVRELLQMKPPVMVEYTTGDHLAGGYWVDSGRINLNIDVYFNFIDDGMVKIYDKYVKNISYDKMVDIIHNWGNVAPPAVIAKYNAAVYKKMESTLIHELQHGLDFSRSGGKYAKDKASISYFDKIKSGEYKSMVRDDSPKSAEQWRDYFNLPHEYWARFSQFVHATKWHYKRKLMDQRPQDLLVALKLKFPHWDWLDDTSKRRVLKATINYYEALKKGYQGSKIIGEPSKFQKRMSISSKIRRV